MENVQDIFIVGTVFGSAVLIVACSLFYHFRKEQLRSKERLTAIEKGIAPKELFAEGDNGNGCRVYYNRREREIYGGIKLLIIGLFLALALYYSVGGEHFGGSASVWGLFVAGVGLAKIIVGVLMKKEPESNTTPQL